MPEFVGEREPLPHDRLVAVDEDVAAAALPTLQTRQTVGKGKDGDRNPGDIFDGGQDVGQRPVKAQPQARTRAAGSIRTSGRLLQHVHLPTASIWRMPSMRREHRSTAA